MVEKSHLLKAMTRSECKMNYLNNLSNIQEADIDDIVNCGIPRNVAELVKEKLEKKDD